MAKTLYCWRCKKDVPMLEEGEWAQMEPRLGKRIEAIKEYRSQHNVSLAEIPAEAWDEINREVLDLYFSLTGLQEMQPEAIGHHRVRQYGPPCKSCGKPFRTVSALVCAECGADRDSRLDREVL